MIFSLIALACASDHTKEHGHWRVASKDGKISSWLAPKNAAEDTSAIPGDSSVHLVACCLFGCFLSAPGLSRSLMKISCFIS